MPEYGEKCQSWFPRIQDIFRLLVLSNQQSKIQGYSIYNNIKQRKAEQAGIR